MKKLEGSYIQIVDFPEKWNLKTNSELINFFDKKGNCQIIFKIGGNENIIFNIVYPKKTLTFISQPIKFSNAKRGIFYIAWSNEVEDVLINDKKIDAYSNNTSFHIINSKPKSEIPLPQIDSKEVRNACIDWINWRNEFTNTPKNPKAGRRLKTEEEDLKRLNEALNQLKLIIQDDFTNKHIPLIFSILRALLYWRKGNKNYDPLFFRIAGKLNCALPVFAFPKGSMNELFDKNRYFLIICGNYPSLIKNYPKQEIIDFQEWLDSTIILDRQDSPFSYKDLIQEGANADSYAHFDRDISLKIDTLNDNLIENSEMLLHFAKAITLITIHYGDFIINRISLIK